MTIRITRHAEMRMKERLNVKNIHKGERIAQNAWERDRRLTNNIPDYDFGKEIICYSQNTFVFSNSGVLVTVFPEAKNKKSLYDLKERYLFDNNYDFYEEEERIY